MIEVEYLNNLRKIPQVPIISTTIRHWGSRWFLEGFTTQNTTPPECSDINIYEKIAVAVSGYLDRGIRLFGISSRHSDRSKKYKAVWLLTCSSEFGAGIGTRDSLQPIYDMGFAKKTQKTECYLRNFRPNLFSLSPFTIRWMLIDNCNHDLCWVLSLLVFFRPSLSCHHVAIVTDCAICYIGEYHFSIHSQNPLPPSLAEFRVNSINSCQFFKI